MLTQLKFVERKNQRDYIHIQSLEGDFNVEHPYWGYSKADGPGRRLWQLGQDLNLSLLTDPRKERALAAVCCDTTTDLSCCHSSLVSDHYVLTIQVRTSPCTPRPHTARHTEWDAFRERRLHCDHSVIDSRLAHLCAARTGLNNLWHKRRHNRRLRRRIAHVNLGTALLGALRSVGLQANLASPPPPPRPASAKSVARQQLERVIPAHPGDTSSLMADLAAKYFQLLPPGPPFTPSCLLLRGPQPRAGRRHHGSGGLRGIT
ncbi:hypothetical protein HPB52_010890 [Rhipicephalus sanguineus]|uniref:Tick transposon n=1 Tax=Rhipicephalus sanguineus TaxID=34632 RepID=A0A9D4PWR8_RHISA|nr:hypothetical protein HPB52_010890 [Rhipicephalus sanguineus]